VEAVEAEELAGTPPQQVELVEQQPLLVQHPQQVVEVEVVLTQTLVQTHKIMVEMQQIIVVNMELAQ
jgi:hypothetical protein